MLLQCTVHFGRTTPGSGNAAPGLIFSLLSLHPHPAQPLPGAHVQKGPASFVAPAHKWIGLVPEDVSLATFRV